MASEGYEDLSWFHGVFIASSPIVVAAIAAGYKPGILLGFGLLFFSSGEWINNMIAHEIVPGGIFKYRVRVHRIHGWLFVLVGVPLILLGFYDLVVKHAG